MQGARELEAHLSSLRGSEAYQNYQRVRELVLRLNGAETRKWHDIYRPSEYWREELANFDYMLDASPLIIHKLRHHTYHITGLRVYDYRSHKDEGRAKLEEKLRALRALDRHGLLVPESRALGGFGFEIEGNLINIDTLKFYEAMIALERAAVLHTLQTDGRRSLVWEIGAGWGGFAYQFKTLFPNVTYVITDFPELFIFSGVYLMTLFPTAQVRFAGEGPDAALFAGWQDADFIFLPQTYLEKFSPPCVDLTVNMVSFQEMTTEQVDAYVRRAYDLGSSFLYSLNRDRSPYNVELTSVGAVLERYYWPHEIPVLPVSYTQMLDRAKGPKEKVKSAAKASVKGKEDLAYKHIVGRRRILL